MQWKTHPCPQRANHEVPCIVSLVIKGSTTILFNSIEYCAEKSLYQETPRLRTSLGLRHGYMPCAARMVAPRALQSDLSGQSFLWRLSSCGMRMALPPSIANMVWKANQELKRDFPCSVSHHKRKLTYSQPRNVNLLEPKLGFPATDATDAGARSRKVAGAEGLEGLGVRVVRIAARACQRLGVFAYVLLAARTWPVVSCGFPCPQENGLFPNDGFPAVSA